VGWFRKTFCFYGLEDTDLGWRLAQADCQFYLEQTPVYHLFHENVRSEFFNSSYRRQKLLKTTAEIFFYNNLSPDIYRVFQYLLNSWIF
jgi:GT2 family glycosyltransferase